MNDELPPLPECRVPDPNGAGWFTAGQMRAYAAEAVRVALEIAARIAETPFTGEQDDITMAAKDRVADAIRAIIPKDRT